MRNDGTRVEPNRRETKKKDQEMRRGICTEPNPMKCGGTECDH